MKNISIHNALGKKMMRVHKGTVLFVYLLENLYLCRLIEKEL